MRRAEQELRARENDWLPELDSALRGLYGERAPEMAERLIEVARRRHTDRSKVLRERDRRRALHPDWFQQPDHVGYMAYVDKFGGNLNGVRERIPHLNELGVDVLHLLSLFAARVGDNDGGYAIRDYLRPDERIGTPADLDDLIGALHGADINLCADFVLNHTSDDHDWATRALAGSGYHQDLFVMFRDNTEPLEYEATLPEVFPQMAPGNFTWRPEIDRWVWTTFCEFQWDLNWSNPDVMYEMGDVALGLANLGVDMLRLDAIAFTWKRLGTNCQNQPEAHLVAQALRALLAIAAPATVLLAEAIVGPDDLVGYLGRHKLERRECELAYHNQLMVQGWSMLATGESRLARVALSRLPDPPTITSWFTYVRCHDDIGWAIDDADAGAAGVSGAGHRAFLAAYYRGDFPHSSSRGISFATNEGTGDERTNGMTADLVGVTAALDADDPAALDVAIDRAVLLYGIAFGHGGIPIVYMGDELGQSNDLAALQDVELAADTRWVHRPAFDDHARERRTDPNGVPGRLWAAFRMLIEARRGCPALHGGAPVTYVDVGEEQVFCWRRHHPRFGALVGLANVGSTSVTIELDTTGVDAVTGRPIDLLAPNAAVLGELAPYQVRWLVSSVAYATMPAVPS
jgi:amylosucrase